MSLIHLFVACIAAFAILHFFAIPRLARQIALDRGPTIASKWMLESVLKVLRTFAFVGSITSLVAILGLGVVKLSGGATTAEVGATIQWLTRLEASLGEISGFWSLALTVLLCGMLIHLARKQARARFETLFARKHEDEVAKIRQALDNGTLEAMPDSEEMKGYRERFERLAVVRSQVTEQLGKANEQEPPDEQQIATLQGQVEEIERALDLCREAYQRADLLRRMDLRLDPDQIASPPPRTFMERIVALFVSKGMLSSLNRSAKTLYIAVLLLLPFPLLGVNAAQLGGAIGAHVVELSDLKLRLSAAEAKEQWEQAKAAAPQPAEAPASSAPESDDDTTLDQYAQAFESAWGHYLVSHVAGRTPVSLAAARARQDVLHEFVAARRGNEVAQHATLEQIADLDSVERQVIQASGAPDRSHTEIGRRFREDLRELRQTNQNALAAVKRGFDAHLRSFRVPASTHDVTSSMMVHVFGNILEGTPLDDFDAGRLAKPFLHGVVDQAQADRAYQVSRDRFLAGIARGQSLDEAAQHAFSDGAPLWTDAQVDAFKAAVTEVDEKGALHRKVMHAPPSLQITGSSTARFEDASQTAARIASRSSPRAREEMSQAFAEFDDWFPGQQGSETRTRRAEIIAQLDELGNQAGDFHPGGVPGGAGGGGVGGGGSGGAIPSGGGGRTAHATSRASGSPVAFQRSRSFVSLRGFSRIGGVLIGREPDSAPPLDFVDVTWTKTGFTLSLVLTRRDGVQVSTGPWRAGVVHEALAYAADGRPVTVTMVTAPPVPDLKIMLHPALVDTALGCRAIELDRLVDTHAPFSEERESINIQARLYRLAWGYRVLGLLGGTEVDADPEYRQIRQSVQHGVATISIDLKRVPDRKFAKIVEAIEDPQRSPLVVKKEFFDQSLVEALAACKASNFAEFDNCLQQNASIRGAATSEAAVQRMFARPPEFQIWSGVREYPYSLDQDLAFLKPPTQIDGTKRPPLWPFEFMIQVAFTSSPEFGGAAANDSDYTDEQPWEFPTLRGRVDTTVAKALQTHPVDAAVVADLREFALLQRLFRAAFAGRLGPSFPTERLVLLARQTAGAVKQERTFRWNARLLPASLADGDDRIAEVLQLRRQLGIEAEANRIRPGMVCGAP